jgi:nucleoside-diphosphate-sugar epimerase
MLKNILITGGTGFLGQHTIKLLLQKFSDAKIVVLGRKKKELLFYDFYDNPNISMCFDHDITDYQKILPKFNNIDAVINIAGFISFFSKDKERLFGINHKGAVNVINACIASKVKKLIHISSTAALGYIDKTLIEEGYTHDWSRDTSQHYALSKLYAEKYLKTVKDLDWTILNSSLIMGPGDTENTVYLFKAINSGKLFFSTSGGNAITDVRDVAKAIMILMDKGKPYENYIASNHNCSFAKLNELIANSLHKKPPWFVLPRIFQGPLTFFFNFFENSLRKETPIATNSIKQAFIHRYFSSAKLKNLGWEPEFVLEDTVQDSISWYKENNLL